MLGLKVYATMPGSLIGQFLLFYLPGLARVFQILRLIPNIGAALLPSYPAPSKGWSLSGPEGPGAVVIHTISQGPDQRVGHPRVDSEAPQFLHPEDFMLRMLL